MCECVSLIGRLLYRCCVLGSATRVAKGKIEIPVFSRPSPVEEKRLRKEMRGSFFGFESDLLGSKRDSGLPCKSIPYQGEKIFAEAALFQGQAHVWGGNRKHGNRKHGVDRLMQLCG